MGTINRFVFCGAHGTGKGYLGQWLANELNLEFYNSPVSSFWELIGKPNLKLIDQKSRMLYQFALLGAVAEQLSCIQGGVFERTPIDVLAYTIQLTEKSEQMYREGALSLDELNIIKDLDVANILKKHIYETTDKFVDLIIHIPFDEEINLLRGEHTDYREDPNNALRNAQIVEECLQEYFARPETISKTSFIHINAGIEGREEMLLSAIELIQGGESIVDNGGFNPLV